MANLTFDTIKLKESAGWRVIEVAEWVKLDIQMKVGLILKNEVEFTLQGQQVAPAKAIESLKKSGT
ncbi:MAG: hypothetical protein HY059_22600 [Proteobacteria bacterium]|nr:hypothetical protein [Pseudomonadota bacterium]